MKKIFAILFLFKSFSTNAQDVIGPAAVLVNVEWKVMRTSYRSPVCPMEDIYIFERLCLPDNVIINIKNKTTRTISWDEESNGEKIVINDDEFEEKRMYQFPKKISKSKDGKTILVLKEDIGTSVPSAWDEVMILEYNKKVAK